MANSARGLIGSLFDFSFSSFISTRIIRFLYGLAVLMSAIWAIIAIVGGFGQGLAEGLLFLIVSPLLFLILVGWSRVMLELMIVLFRIAENVQTLADARQDSAV